jgi:hypothetical protein
MLPREMVDHDVVGYGRTCPHCGEGYTANRLVFEPAGQQFSIHQSCVQQLAASLVDEDTEAILRRYDELREELSG